MSRPSLISGKTKMFEIHKFYFIFSTNLLTLVEVHIRMRLGDAYTNRGGKSVHTYLNANFKSIDISKNQS